MAGTIEKIVVGGVANAALGQGLTHQAVSKLTRLAIQRSTIDKIIEATIAV